jgi:hypothetical protein
MASKSRGCATPDRMPRFQGESRLDKAEHGTHGHDMTSVIKGSAKLKSSPHGPHCHLDGPASGRGAKVSGSNLGTGADSLADAAYSIPSGAQTPCVDWAKVKRGS